MVNDQLVLQKLLRGLDLKANMLFEVVPCLFFKRISRSAILGIEFDLEGDDCTHEPPVLSDEHDVAAARADVLEVVLDRYGCYVLPAGGDDQLLDPANDLYLALLVYEAAITSLEEAILIDALPGGLLVVLVAHHDMAATDEYLAFAILVWLVNHDLTSSCLHACMQQTEVEHVVHCGRARCLTQAIEVEQRHVKCSEEVDGRLLHGSCPVGKEEAVLEANRFLDLAQQ